ncbi:formate dehydrogenase subunit delta [Haloechinothrix salitolerans]|uniref:Formate dehydrogenase subunit delta n=1 Tax=Haloechinothrix salitolerans TaxID=926830 RepID=A0ABW2C5Z4_9PSEU
MSEPSAAPVSADHDARHGKTPPPVRLANDIAAQFRHRTAQQAAQEIAQHIRMFWDPRMRAELLRCAAADPNSLDPLALAASREIS